MVRLQTNARAGGIIDRLKTAFTQFFQNIDWNAVLQIVEQLIPIIVACFAPVSAHEAQAYVAKRWSTTGNQKYGGYDKRLVKATTRRVLQAAYKQRMYLTWDQAYSIALCTLDDIRTGDINQADLVIREVLDQPSPPDPMEN